MHLSALAIVTGCGHAQEPVVPQPLPVPPVASASQETAPPRPMVSEPAKPIDPLVELLNKEGGTVTQVTRSGRSFDATVRLELLKPVTFAATTLGKRIASNEKFFPFSVEEKGDASVTLHGRFEKADVDCQDAQLRLDLAGTVLTRVRLTCAPRVLPRAASGPIPILLKGTYERSGMGFFVDNRGDVYTFWSRLQLDTVRSIEDVGERRFVGSLPPKDVDLLTEYIPLIEKEPISRFPRDRSLIRVAPDLYSVAYAAQGGTKVVSLKGAEHRHEGFASTVVMLIADQAATMTR